MLLIGTHIAISWDFCKPFHYGEYKGKLKDGKDCKIDIDWNVKAYTMDGEQVGSDQIKYWLCGIDHVKALIDDAGNN